MSDGIVIQIDGRDYTIPDDLDLNDVVAIEDEGFSLENMNSMKAVRCVVWRLLLRHQPGITIEEAGAKVPLSMFAGEASEEGPPPIPLSVPDPPSGTSTDAGNGNGTTGTDVKVETHAAIGRP